MKTLPLALCLLSCTLAYAENWTPLFNGKDFTGWETYLSKPAASVDVPGLSRDAKGEYTQPIGVNHDPFGAFSWVPLDGGPVLRIAGEVPGGIATLASYANFHLRLQYKWGALRSGQKPNALRNSGLLYHGHGQHGEGNGRWLPSHQFQIQNGFAGDYIAMGDGSAVIHARKVDEKRYVYDAVSAEVPFTNTAPDPARCGRAGDPEKSMDEWNTIDLYCVGDQAIHVVNGKVVMRVASRVRTKEGMLQPLDHGRIELQAEGWEIFYRNVEISPITDFPAEVK